METLQCVCEKPILEVYSASSVLQVPVLLALAYVALWLHHKLQWAMPPLPSSPPPLQGPAITKVQAQ